MKKVGIVMGSTSDLPVVEKAISVLQEYGVPVSCPLTVVRMKQEILLHLRGRAVFLF